MVVLIRNKATRMMEKKNNVITVRELLVQLTRVGAKMSAISTNRIWRFRTRVLV